MTTQEIARAFSCRTAKEIADMPASCSRSRGFPPAPSAQGTRLQFKVGRQVSAVDRPFAESKELIAGFCLITVPSKEAALAWAERYGSILTDLQVDVLRLHEQAAFDGK